jgi:hypothetical protein
MTRVGMQIDPDSIPTLRHIGSLGLLPHFRSDCWACVDFVMQILWRHVLEQFIKGDSRLRQGRDEQLAVM